MKKGLKAFETSLDNTYKDCVKPIFELKVNNWNKCTKSEQDKALLWLQRLTSNLIRLRKTGLIDDFIGKEIYEEQKRMRRKNIYV